MLKIYSRPRIKIPIIRNNGLPRGRRNINRSKLRKFIEIIVVLMIILIIVVILLNNMLPVFNTLCIQKAKSIATIVTNEETTKVMENYAYSDLYNIEKDNNGKIIMVSSNVNTINKAISDIAGNIQNSLNNNPRDDIEIALGSFTGVKLLSGRGPSVKIRIITVGDIDTDLRSEFTEQGINQTLHRVYLNIFCHVDILTPFENFESKIENQVLLAENVIVGEFPDTYYNLNGLDSGKDSLKLID